MQSILRPVDCNRRRVPGDLAAPPMHERGRSILGCGSWAVGGRSNIKDADDIYLPTTVRYWRPASLLTSRNARYSMINDVDAFRKWLVVVEYQLGPRP